MQLDRSPVQTPHVLSEAHVFVTAGQSEGQMLVAAYELHTAVPVYSKHAFLSLHQLPLTDVAAVHDAHVEYDKLFGGVHTPETHEFGAAQLDEEHAAAPPQEANG